MSFRTSVLQIVDTPGKIPAMPLSSEILNLLLLPAFEWIVLVLIFASSVTLCFEDIHLDKNVRLKVNQESIRFRKLLPNKTFCFSPSVFFIGPIFSSRVSLSSKCFSNGLRTVSPSTSQAFGQFSISSSSLCLSSRY